MIMVRSIGMVTLSLLAFVSAGCVGRLIGEGAEGALGPKGVYWEEKPVAQREDARPLGPYRRFELGEVTNEYGRHVPQAFLAEFPRQFQERLADSDLPMEPSGRTLVFRVAIIHYERADLSDNVFGPLEQVLARVELVDKESGDVVASGNAVGRTGKTVGLGTETKAEGLAKALIKWVSDYHPDARDEEEEED